MKLKIMQYNIRTGFRSMEKPYNYDSNRIELAKEIVRKENPDILILNEAYFESENESKILMDYQKVFKFPFYVHGNSKGGLSPFWGCALLSKYPIIEVNNKNRGLGGFFRSKINVKEKIMNLDITHISPIPYLGNKGQESCIKQILKDKKENYILAGDFNSLSPKDDYKESTLVEAWTKFEKNAKKLIKQMLKRDAIKFVLSSGLVDTYKARNAKFDFTIPTNFLSNDKSSGIRIDYIFCSKEFRVLESGIIKNNLTEQASDHYPIYAVLEI